MDSPKTLGQTLEISLDFIKEKETNSEEYADMDSKFSEKCLSIQRNLMPDIPRNTTFEKVIENISKTSTSVDKNI